MRLLKYISFAELPKEINIFRAMSFKLNENPVDYSNILEHIKDRDEVKVILEKMNKELKSVYTGKHLFALCLNEGLSIDKIKISRKYTTKLKSLQYESNNKLAKIKGKIELIS